MPTTWTVGRFSSSSKRPIVVCWCCMWLKEWNKRREPGFDQDQPDDGRHGTLPDALGDPRLSAAPEWEWEGEDSCSAAWRFPIIEKMVKREMKWCDEERETGGKRENE